MHIWLGTPVITRDGAQVGHADKLIVHPASWKVLRVIVGRGPRFKHREVALDPSDVERASPAGTWLDIGRTAFDRLRSARTSDRQRPPREWATPLGWLPRRVYWPAGYRGPVHPEITASQLRVWGTLRTNVDNKGHAPAAGPDVLTQDGRKVGRCARLVLDPATDEIQRVTFEGDDVVWPRAPVELPGYWVAKHDRWTVNLVFDVKTIHELASLWAVARPVAAAGDRIQTEVERQRRGDSLYEVDPYDVLAQPSETGFTTPFERDEASVINPQPHHQAT